MKFRDIIYGPGVAFVERSLPPEPQTLIKDQLPEAESVPNETMASVEEAEVIRIVQSWDTIMGVKLDPNIVQKHLETLRRWEAQWQKNRAGGERRI